MDGRAAAEARAQVQNTAKHDVGEALLLARAIPHPWYRCQALAHVAELLKNPTGAEQVLDEALDAARAQTEPNRIVTVASWPIGVMVRRGLGNPAAVVDRMLEVIAPEPNPVRRAHALFMLFHSVFSDAQLRDKVLEKLLASCAEARGWKSRRVQQFVAEMMRPIDRERALAIAAAIPESREARRARRWLA